MGGSSPKKQGILVIKQSWGKSTDRMGGSLSWGKTAQMVGISSKSCWITGVLRWFCWWKSEVLIKQPQQLVMCFKFCPNCFDLYGSPNTCIGAAFRIIQPWQSLDILKQVFIFRWFCLIPISIAANKTSHLATQPVKLPKFY